MIITGKIVHGAGRGKGLGFPTINLDVRPTGLDFGVYACHVTLNGRTYEGAAHFGARPTFHESKPVFEVFILDFSGNEYGEQATVEIVAKIREIIQFDSPAALKAQMEKDVQEVRRVLSDA